MEVTQVREIIRMQDITRMPKAPHFVEGIINLRGQIIAVLDLAQRLGLGSGRAGIRDPHSGGGGGTTSR